jgi:LEA14-like dessication related protein
MILRKAHSLYVISFFVMITTLNSCITYKPVYIKEIKSVKAKNNDISTGKIVVNLSVSNPNNYAIKFKKYNIHAFVNNTDLGEVRIEDKIVLSKESEKDYTIVVTPDVAKILGVLPSLYLKGNGEASLKGSVKVKALFLSKTFPVDLKKKISASDLR